MLYEYLLCTLLHKDINLKNNIWATIAKKLSNKINGKKNSGKLQYQSIFITYLNGEQSINLWYIVRKAIRGHP